MSRPSLKPLIYEIHEVMNAAKGIFPDNLPSEKPEAIYVAVENISAALKNAQEASATILVGLRKTLGKPMQEEPPRFAADDIGPGMSVCGGWLHIALHNAPPDYWSNRLDCLQEIIAAMLERFKQNGGTIPTYESPMVVIDEKYDPGQPAISAEANKEVLSILQKHLFPNRPEFGVMRLGAPYNNKIHNIYIIEALDAGDFLNKHCAGSITC